MDRLHTAHNRPVHLARGDAFLERAIELIYSPRQDLDLAARLRQAERVHELLDSALRHVKLAGRARQVSSKETQFVHFLEVVRQSVRSVQALLQNQALFETSERSFLAQFLGDGNQEALLSALNFQRSSEGMVQGLWQLLRLAHTPYRALQQQQQEEMDESDRTRYQTAYVCFRAEVMKRFPADRIVVSP